MKTRILLILALAAFGLQSCSDDGFHYHDPYTSADVLYDYWTGPSGTLIDGEVYNEGNTFLEEVEVEVRFYNSRGRLVFKDWYWIDTYTHPGEVSYFSLDLPEPHIYDMDLFITDYRW